MQFVRTSHPTAIFVCPQRAVIVKQLSSGLLLVNGRDTVAGSTIILASASSRLGPHKLNGVPLRRINQIYVIGTSTKLDLAAANFENLDDPFFKRVRPAKKNADKDIFDAKKEVRAMLHRETGLSDFESDRN